MYVSYGRGILFPNTGRRAQLYSVALVQLTLQNDCCYCEMPDGLVQISSRSSPRFPRDVLTHFSSAAALGRPPICVQQCTT
jgi:hypothetical protein